MEILCNCEICDRVFYRKSESKLRILSKHFSLHHSEIDFHKYCLEKQILEIPKCRFCGKNRKQRLSNPFKFFSTCKEENCIKESKRASLETKLKMSGSRIRYLKSLGKNSIHKKGEESYWEKYFRENVLEKEKLFEKYKIVQEYKEGTYSLDFAIFGNGCKIDLEIDGWQHFTDEHIKYDERRNRFLENLGWKIYRISCKDLKNNYEEERANFLIFLDKDKLLEFNFEEYVERKIFKYRDIKISQQTLISSENKKKRMEKINSNINRIISSGIDFSKFGWAMRVSEILEISPQKVSKWMKRNLPDFYEKNCFKKR